MGGSSFERGPTGSEDATEAAVVCPRLHAAVELIGRRWSGAILYTLIERPHFFRELGAAVPGISDRLLSARLRELESEGLVDRCVHEGPPARVSYALSDAGRELEPALSELHDWAQRHDVSGSDGAGVNGNGSSNGHRPT